MSHKISKAHAVYVEDDPDGDYFCGSCMMFIKDRNECTAVEGYIDEKGGCIYYKRGKNASIENINPHRLDKHQSLYEFQPEGFSCKRCRHFMSEEKECIRVEGDIKPNGCCNAWESKEKSMNRMGIMVGMMKK